MSLVLGVIGALMLFEAAEDQNRDTLGRLLFAAIGAAIVALGFAFGLKLI